MGGQQRLQAFPIHLDRKGSERPHSGEKSQLNVSGHFHLTGSFSPNRSQAGQRNTVNMRLPPPVT